MQPIPERQEQNAEVTPEQWAAIGPVLVSQRRHLHARTAKLEDELMDLQVNMAMRDKQLAAQQERIASLEGDLAESRHAIQTLEAKVRELRGRKLGSRVT